MCGEKKDILATNITGIVVGFIFRINLRLRVWTSTFSRINARVLFACAWIDLYSNPWILMNLIMFAQTRKSHSRMTTWVSQAEYLNSKSWMCLIIYDALFKTRVIQIIHTYLSQRCINRSYSFYCLQLLIRVYTTSGLAPSDYPTAVVT